MRRLAFTPVVVLMALVVAACAASPAATPVPTAMPTPAPIATATAAPMAATPTSVTAVAGTVVATTIIVVNDAKLGSILADPKGMTLYRYTKDEANVSNCYDQCAKNWPPLLLASGDPVAPAGVTGTLGVITRTDGTRQVTYNKMPLYYFIKDKQPGDTTGQGVSNVWYVVEAAMSSSSPSPSSSSSPYSY